MYLSLINILVKHFYYCYSNHSFIPPESGPLPSETRQYFASKKAMFSGKENNVFLPKKQCFSTAHPMTLKRAKRKSNCFSPACSKRMVALALSPAPSTRSTSPRPKRSCSISCPACRPSPPDGAGAAPVTASTRFSLRGTVGAMSGSRENFRSPAGDEADVPYWGRAAEWNKSSDERRKRSAPSSTRRPNREFCGRLR